MLLEVKSDGLVVTVSLGLADLTLELDSLGLLTVRPVVLLVIFPHRDPVSAAQVAADGGAVVGETGSTDQTRVLANLQVGRGEGGLVEFEVLRVLAVEMLDEMTMPHLPGTVKAGRHLGLVPRSRFVFRLRLILWLLWSSSWF